MNPYSDNSRTAAQKERDWYETIKALHFAFYGPKLHVPTMSDFRLQDPSKPSSGYSYCATVGDLMKNSTIYLCCNDRACAAKVPFRVEYLEQRKDQA